MQWADALHQWLGITEDRVHVVTGKQNASIAGLRFDFLIVSYNMVRRGRVVKHSHSVGFTW